MFLWGIRFKSITWYNETWSQHYVKSVAYLDLFFNQGYLNQHLDYGMDK